MPSEWLHQYPNGHSEWLPYRPDEKVEKTGNVWRKPLESIGRGCHSTQAREMNRLVREKGITGVHYREKDGKCELTSRRGRAEELRRRGLCDLDGGYGDG